MKMEAVYFTETSLIICWTSWRHIQDHKGKNKLRGLSSRANYFDRATADRKCHVVSMTYLYSRIFGFLDRSRYFFFQVAP
jgi:hypothetical protein